MDTRRRASHVASAASHLAVSRTFALERATIAACLASSLPLSALYDAARATLDAIAGSGPAQTTIAAPEQAAAALILAEIEAAETIDASAREMIRHLRLAWIGSRLDDGRSLPHVELLRKAARLAGEAA